MLHRRKLTRTIGGCFVCLTVSILWGTLAAAEARPPNVVLIVTDDQGYGDFGFHGNPILRTPALDAMARRSARLAYFYVNPVCAPTRASLMTGRYNYRTRVVDTFVGRAMMDTDELTIAEILRAHGYATGIFGKWHLGDNYPLRAMDQGFEEALVHRGGGIGQPSDPPDAVGKYTDPVLFHNGRKVRTKGYCTDVYFDAALQWMQGVQREGRRFFAYLPTNAPHGPFHDVPAELYDYYRKMDLRNSRFPQEQGHPLTTKENVDRRARIFAMIDNIDRNVGRLFVRLDAMGLSEDTIVLFMVDNGPNGDRYVSGMRGRKADVYEGGIRSPFLVHWPHELKAGHVVEQVGAHIDVMPTILDACGIEILSGRHIDGRSLLPLLKGESVSWPERTIFIQSHRGNQPIRYHNFAARSQHWKLVCASGFRLEKPSGPPKFELYDMQNDSLEMRDLAGERPAVLARVKAQYEEWFEDVSRTRQNNYSPPRIHLGTARENPVVLTRQDWIHEVGRPWAADSNGHWQLYVARAGEYDIEVAWRSEPVVGMLRLEVAESTEIATVSPRATSFVFRRIRLQRGDLNLRAVLSFVHKVKGPWHVRVRVRS